jgi:hypothetical protein
MSCAAFVIALLWYWVGRAVVLYAWHDLVEHCVLQYDSSEGTIPSYVDCDIVARVVHRVPYDDRRMVGKNCLSELVHGAT